MTDESNERQRRRELEQLRRDGDISNSITTGYRDQAGRVPRTIPGDKDAPHVKNPPFPSNVTSWYTAETGADPNLPVDNYIFTPPLDVESRRTLNVWFAFTVDPNESALLSLVPQAFTDDEGETGDFWNTIVIDSALSVLDLSATVLAAPEVGSRTFRIAELRTPTLAAGGTEVVWRAIIPFDVSMWSRFRLAVGTTDDGGALALGYSFAN